MAGTVKFSAANTYERLLSEDEALRLLGLDQRPNPKGALRWLIRTRKLAYVKLARGIMGFRRDDLMAFIERHRVPADAEKDEKRVSAP